jgi:List-Bact-rpt repeat protein
VRLRSAVLAAAIAALAACGNSDHASGGSGSGGGTVTLHIDTKGNGLVSSAGMDCRGTCGQSYSTGSTVHLVALPDSGNVFSGWSGACSGTSTTCDLTLTADTGVSASFSVPPPATHKLTMALDGQGRVTSNPSGLDCSGATCSSDFATGTTVALTAAPSSGWTFGGWSGACSGKDTCSVKLDGDVQVGARFDAPPPPPADAHIILAVNGPGQVSGAGLSCGSGATTCDTKVSAGSSQTLKAWPGSQARFISWAGACSGSDPSCTFTANGEVRITANFEYELSTLVANDGTNLPTFAINSTDLFYSRYTNADGNTVWAVSKTGGTPRRLGGGSARFMVADDGYLYWADYWSIYSVPVGGGSPSQIFSGANGIGRLALDETGALYWTSNVWQAWQAGASVHRMQSRIDSTLADKLRAAEGVAVDGKYVYFGTFDNNTFAGVLHRVPREGVGGKVEDVVSCGSPCQVMSIKTDFEHIYLRNNSGQAYAVPKSKPSLVLLSAGNTSSGSGQPDIDANASVVFWNWLTYGSNPTNGIFRANPDGTGFKAVDSGQDYSWYGPRVDDTAIFYYHAGALLKRLK